MMFTMADLFGSHARIGSKEYLRPQQYRRLPGLPEVTAPRFPVSFAQRSCSLSQPWSATQMIMLEGAKATTETVDALRTGASAMKSIQISFWSSPYPEEPYDLAFNITFSEGGAEKFFESVENIKYGLVSAVRRQSIFFHQHGFARNMNWSISDTENVEGNPITTLELKDSPYSCSMWDFGFQALYKVTLNSKSLSTKFIITNTDKKPFSFSSALHTYFRAARKSAPTTGGVKKPHRYHPGTVALRTSGNGYHHMQPFTGQGLV